MERHARSLLTKQLRRSERVYVYEWSHTETAIVGIGPDVNGVASYLETSASPGVYAIASNMDVLALFCSVHKEILSCNKITINSEDVMMNTVNFRPSDIMYSDSATRPGNLVKLETRNFEDALAVHRLISYNERAYKFVSVPPYWDATKFVSFECMIVNETWSPEEIATTFRWMTEDLKISSLNEERQFWFDIPVISYDIETVSDLKNRVPTGIATNDNLFTVSVTHWHAKQQFSVVYLPIVGSSSSLDCAVETLMNHMRSRKLKHISDDNHFLLVFFDEKEALETVFELLSPKRKDSYVFHILTGWNTESYDNKFMLSRATYYGLRNVTDDFVYSGHGLTRGHWQRSMDLYRLIKLRYNFESYKLDSVAYKLLRERKRDVNAVALRFLFDYVRRTNRLLIKSDVTADKIDETETFRGGIDLEYTFKEIPCLVDSVDYNDQDSILVAVMFEKIKTLQDANVRSRECWQPVSNLNSRIARIKPRVLDRCFVSLLKSKNFLAKMENEERHLWYPLPNVMPNVPRNMAYNYLLKSVSVSDMIKKPGPIKRDANGREKLALAGGINFSFGHRYVRSQPNHVLQDLDFVQFFPSIIRDYNISEETVDFLPASYLLMSYDTTKNIEHFRLFDYNNHSDEDKIVTQVMIYNYVKNGTYFGEEFPFTKDELSKRGEDTVLVIYVGRRGLYSLACADAISRREKTKSGLAVLKDVLAAVDERIQFVKDGSDRENERRIDTTVAVELEIDNTEDDSDDGDDSNEEEFSEDSDNDQDSDKQRVVVENKRELWSTRFDFQNLHVSKVITVYATGEIYVDWDVVPSMTLDELNGLRSAVYDEQERYSNAYVLYKTFVSSVYGNLSAQVRSAVTYLGRYILLKTSRMLEKIGCEVLYGDTDGVIVINSTGRDVSYDINNALEVGTIETHKIIASIIVRSKIHLDELSPNSSRVEYTQHKNGPSAYKWAIDFVCDYERKFQIKIKHIEDVQQLWNRFFRTVFVSALANIGYRATEKDNGRVVVEKMDDSVREISSLSDVLINREDEEASGNKSAEEFSLDWFCQDVWVQDSYEKRCTLSEYKTFVSCKYPSLEKLKKHRVFYDIRWDDLSSENLRPSICLYDNNISKLNALRRINVSVFFGAVQKTTYYRLNAFVRQNTAGHNVALNETIEKLVRRVAFETEYRRHLVDPFTEDPDLRHPFF
ncbi:hypothetical protein QAD02_001443 [Eretmocerus hayati]|uniref:Uncharacterized protein n=1 Tax=Eretmocerus hayati TaxID=131215 RepID=A0ACC2NGG2_9HYME|nr:hypothetical protein QAD02_001443 [Eretmocerus hayati]